MWICQRTGELNAVCNDRTWRSNSRVLLEDSVMAERIDMVFVQSYLLLCYILYNLWFSHQLFQYDICVSLSCQTVGRLTDFLLQKFSGDEIRYTKVKFTKKVL